MGGVRVFDLQLLHLRSPLLVHPIRDVWLGLALDLLEQPLAQLVVAESLLALVYPDKSQCCLHVLCLLGRPTASSRFPGVSEPGVLELEAGGPDVDEDTWGVATTELPCTFFRSLIDRCRLGS